MPSFEEHQRLSPVLIGLIYFILLGILAASLISTPPKTEQETMVIVYGMAPAFIIITFIFATMRQMTRVSGEGVHIKSVYFINRVIPFSDIESAEQVTYRPLRDYGGWGFRVSGKGKAYNMRGDRGVKLTLKDGGRVLVGSQREQELAQAICAGLSR
ncbi:MAG: hypothetical protein HKN14_00665 [Marinicaulis sp.]|nr:hypothetical protein [Marinicaulis sp.]NNL88789.1 hypothetical protein [Marinicaulis sp.]